jgi:RimJ/RimL family protein N-acetyltransferase
MGLFHLGHDALGFGNHDVDLFHAMATDRRKRICHRTGSPDYDEQYGRANGRVDRDSGNVPSGGAGNLTLIWAHHADSRPAYLDVVRFVTERMWGRAELIDLGTAVAVTRGVEIIGGVVFHDWQPDFGTLELSAAGSGPWLTRRAIREIARYVFGRMKAQAAVLNTSERNFMARGIAAKLGGVEYRIPRLRGRNEAQITCVVTAEAWRTTRFEGKNHGP